MQDTFKHKGMRKQLVDELRRDPRIPTNSPVFEAILNIPRHFFLDLAFEQQAYTNMAFQIGAGQTISHPITVAFQTYLLDLKKGDKVLEIGTGSGFQTCILCELGAFNFNPRLTFGDGYKGLPAFAPFDRIIVTCGAPDIPKTLLDQLKVGGIMVIPVGEGIEQIMKRIRKVSETEIIEEEFGTFKFVPMLEKTAK